MATRQTDRHSVRAAATPTSIERIADGEPTTRQKLQNMFKRNPPIEKLYDFLLLQTADSEIAWTAAVKIHVRVMMYIRSLRTFKIRKRNNKPDIKFLRTNRGAVGSLERLRTAKGEYARAKAFWELPAPAGKALFMAAARAGRLWDKSEWRPHPDFLLVPDGNIVASLVPEAIKIASRKDSEIKKSNMFTRNNPARERAIEEMMRVYRHLHGNKKPPARKFRKFLKRISAVYQELIPEGFGGGIRANNTYDATFTRILKQALSE
jgi:hypothetical protein